MAGAHDEHAVSMTKAAELLGMDFDDIFDEVFTRRLRSVPWPPTGRPLVPMDAIEERLRERSETASAT